jgi:hypothetical protein
VSWFLNPDSRNNNQLHARRKRLPLFTDPNATRMACLKQRVTELNWMREVFIDASERLINQVKNQHPSSVHNSMGNPMGTWFYPALFLLMQLFLHGHTPWMPEHPVIST